MKIVLIRHGESEANRINREVYPLFCGRWDCPLTEYGVRQAARLKDHPAVADADAVYSSPLKRAVETAGQFSVREIIIDDRLTERTMGDFDGKRISEIESDPAFAKYFRDPQYRDFRASFTTKVPNGENYTDVSARAESFLHDLMKHNYQKAVVVSHLGTIRCLMKIIQNLTEQETVALKIAQCDPIVLELP